MTTKARAAKCVTHHHACDCREYHSQKMESALQVIHTWASCHVKGMNTLDARQVVSLCEKALMKETA